MRVYGRTSPCAKSHPARRPAGALATDSVVWLTYNHMVVDQLRRDERREERTDRLLRALADPTRRDIVIRATNGDHSVSDLARHYPMSFAAVQKHVAVLEEAHLVTKERKGRRQLVRTNIEAVRTARLALDRLEDIWRSRLERFGEVLAEVDDEGAHI
jgi:DNA-binding transcriptional ArsR family regulator